MNPLPKMVRVVDSSLAFASTSAKFQVYVGKRGRYRVHQLALSRVSGGANAVAVTGYIYGTDRTGAITGAAQRYAPGNAASFHDFCATPYNSAYGVISGPFDVLSEAGYITMRYDVGTLGDTFRLRGMFEFMDDADYSPTVVTGTW